MKSYNHLYEQFIDPNNIELAILNAAKGKTKRRKIKKLKKRIDETISTIEEYVANFHNDYNHNPIIINEGTRNKVRTIIVPTPYEHIVHHMVVQTMMPIFTKGMYQHTYSSIPGRGMHKCRKVIAKWLKHPKETKYCLKLDIRKFFNSISNDYIKDVLAWQIHDKRFLHILYEILDVDEGLPLGFFTSHWIANWILQPLDHFIKEELCIKYYARYMDDMVLFADNKKTLTYARKKIAEFLEGMGLEIKNDWQIFRTDYIGKDGKHKGRALDYCGFKFYCDRVTLRKSLLRRLTRKALKIQKKKKCTIYDARQLMSYLGWLSWADVYQVYKKYVAPNISLSKAEDYISKYDRKQASVEKLINSYQKEMTLS